MNRKVNHIYFIRSMFYLLYYLLSIKICLKRYVFQTIYSFNQMLFIYFLEEFIKIQIFMDLVAQLLSSLVTSMNGKTDCKTPSRFALGQSLGCKRLCRITEGLHSPDLHQTQLSQAKQAKHYHPPQRLCDLDLEVPPAVLFSASSSSSPSLD